MGEDVTDMATTTSQLQAKLLALTGGQVDIMADATTFKNSTQILREMAEAWEDMNDIQRASALELMGGKRQANVLSALIQNFDTVEDVIETSANSTGSALRENERYLDSIQGKIDQFNNAMQAMWSNTLDSDMVKGFVSFGTELIKIIDDIGLLKVALMGVGMYLTRGIDFAGAFKPAAESLDQMRQNLATLKVEMDAASAKDARLRTVKSAKQKEIATKRYTDYEVKVQDAERIAKANELQIKHNDLLDKQKVAQDNLNKANHEFIRATRDGAAPVNIEAYGNAVKNAKTELDNIDDQILNNGILLEENGVRLDDLNKKIEMSGDVAQRSGKRGAGGFAKLGKGIKAAGKALKGFLTQMAVMYAITTILEFVGDVFNGVKEWFNDLDETAEEAQDKFEETRSKLSDVQSELNSLNSELEDTQDRIDELMSRGTLSFTEKEELNRLKAENAELERKITLNKSLEASLQKQANSEAIHATDMYLDTSFGSNMSKTERQEKAAEKGGKWGKYGGAAAGAAIGTAIAPGIGTLIGLAIGAFVGEPIGEAIGSATESAAYDAEQTVAQAMDGMIQQRSKLKKNQDEALANGDSEAYKNATEALQIYDKQMAQHISKIQENYNSMDWETATSEQKKQMMEYADWLDSYNISMGVDDAKSNAIARIFGDEAMGGFATAKKEIDKLKKNLTEAKKNGEGVDEALAALKGFKLNLSEEEVERLREMGIYLYEVEDYFKEVVETESEFVDAGLEDVAKDINKITDGLGALKSAFEEVIEKGVLTGKTVLSLKEELNFDQYKDIEGVTAAWNDYLKVMMSGVATTEELTAATEKFATLLINQAFEDGLLNPESKWEYVAQLKALGVENAEELVDDLMQNSMVKELESGMTIDRDAVARHASDASGVDMRGEVDQWSDEDLQAYAEKHGLINTEITEAYKQEIMERYGVEEDAIDAIIAKLEEKADLEQKLANKTTEKDAYDSWRDSMLSHKEDLDDLNVSTVTKAKEALDQENKNRSTVGDDNDVEVDWEAAGIEINWKKGYKYKGIWYSTYEKLDKAVKADAEKLATLQEEYNKLLKEGKDKGWIDENTGEIINIDFKKQIDGLQDQIDGIETEIDEELTVKIQMKLELQNQHELVDDIQNTFDTLVNAQKEYDEAGYISVDTMQTLLQLEPKYLDLLVDEKGNLDLTKGALYEVARARITDLGIKQQSAILDEALTLASKGTKDALLEQILVMEKAKEVGGDWITTQMQQIAVMLDKRVAAKELTKEEATAFLTGTMNQLNAVTAVTQSALVNLENSLSASGNTATAEVDDAFQRAMDYWENRIGANQSLYEQIQNDIDLLEKKGQIAGESYYQAQLDVEEEHLQHLINQRTEAQGFLDDFAEGSDEWWEVANTLNDIENEIDAVTLSIQDLNDAMDQVHWAVFDEAHERISDLTSQLSNVRDLLSVDEDSFFNDEGEWTETGVAVLGTHIQEIELYKNALADINNELAELDIGDFDSEQEYYDKLTELTNQQYDYTKAISDSEQSVVDMYESSIDAIEEYTQTLVDSYNDYIDSVKEALDAERDYTLWKQSLVRCV